jgi:DNA polymerase delta subunit 1
MQSKQWIGRPDLPKVWKCHEVPLDLMLCDISISAAAKKVRKAWQSSKRQRVAQPQPPAEKPTCVYRLFGVTKEGYSVVVCALGSRPRFYVDVPREWGQWQAEKLIDALRAELDKVEDELGAQLVAFELSTAQRIYGFTNGELAQFLKLEFDTVKAYQKTRNLFEHDVKIEELPEAPKRYSLAETKLPHELQFLLEHKLPSAGWLRLEPGTYWPLPGTLPETHCQLAFASGVAALKPLNDRDDVAPFIIVSFDLECMRASMDGLLPDPEVQGDEIIQIGCSVLRWGDAQPLHQSIFTLGTCDDIDGVLVRSFKTEKDLLLAWQEYWCKELDPDLITGYNIGFDLNYLLGRSRTLTLRNFLALGKIVGEVPWIKNNGQGNDYPDVPMVGRVQVDMLKVNSLSHHNIFY